MAALSLAASVSAECPSPCETTEYCDAFNNVCRPCNDICSIDGDFNHCAELCHEYLKSIVFTEPHQVDSSTKEDLRTVHYLLIAVLSVTSVTMLLLVALVVLKIKGKKRQEKTDVIPLSTLNQQHSVPSSLELPTYAQTSNGPGSVLAPSKSLQTMTTQVSQSVNGSVAGRRRPVNGHGRGSPGSLGSTVNRSRAPTEDSVLPPMPEEGEAYDNLGMVPSPTSSGSEGNKNQLSPIGNRPYTISHSQVV